MFLNKIRISLQKKVQLIFMFLNYELYTNYGRYSLFLCFSRKRRALIKVQLIFMYFLKNAHKFKEFTAYFHVFQ